MQFVDTHAHLYLENFDEDRKRVVDNATKENVTKIFLPNIDTATITDMLKLCSDFPNICYPMMGLHPCSIKENYKQELAMVESHLQSGDFIAIGEIGMDAYWSREFLAEQTECFVYQLSLSVKHNLPVSIHIRNAHREVFAVLETFKNQTLKGVFHCFSGTKEHALKAIEAGFLLGIGGIITFKNNPLRNFLAELPLQSIVLETDSPYLAPQPFRGKRNESKYLKHIAQEVARIYDISVEEVAAQTTKTALKTFTLKP